MKLMEEVYKEQKVKAECSSSEDYMENYAETNKPLFTEVLYKFHICLDCGYTVWEGCCATCALVEITLLDIMHKDKVWFDVGRGFFISRMIKF